MASCISNATLLVPTYNAGIDFFVGALGFALLEDTPLNETKRWVRVAPPGAQTALLLAEPANDAQRAALGNQSGGRVAFFLETDNFDRDHGLFLERGVRFLEAPRHESYGTVAVFEDPFGNRWDLIEPIPAQPGG